MHLAPNVPLADGSESRGKPWASKRILQLAMWDKRPTSLRGVQSSRGDSPRARLNERAERRIAQRARGFVSDAADCGTYVAATSQ